MRNCAAVCCNDSLEGNLRCKAHDVNDIKTSNGCFINESDCRSNREIVMTLHIIWRGNKSSLLSNRTEMKFRKADEQVERCEWKARYDGVDLIRNE